MSFTAETAVTETTGPRRYSSEIRPGWEHAGNTNGGYLLAITARAAAHAAGGRVPTTITGHFLSPGKPGEVSIAVEVLKQGKRFTMARATMSDGRRPVLAMLGAFSELDMGSAPAIERIGADPPAMPEPGDCVPILPAEGVPLPMMDKLEVRLHPEDATLATGLPRVRGWFRLRNDEPIDQLGILLAVDAFPPTAFAARLPVAWTPTVELTTHIRSLPEPGWLRCAFTSRFISGGLLEEDGEVWDALGRPVAQSRQLALVPRG